MTKAIVSGIAAFLIFMGCMYVYQRETAIINNQSQLAQAVSAHDQVLRQIITRLRNENTSVNTPTAVLS